MCGRRREQFTGIYPGSYTIGEATKADIPVIAQGPEGPVVVGRFPITKVADGHAQALAYASLPLMIKILKELGALGTTGGMSEDARMVLAAAGVTQP